MERIIMRKKIKMCRFGAAHLMNKLAVLPRVYSEKEEDIDITEKEEDIDITPFKEFIEQNKKDLASLGSYFEKVASEYKVDTPIPKLSKSYETKINNLVTQTEQVIKKNYSDILVEPSIKIGMMVYYTGDDAKWLLEKYNDNNRYFGHCIGFNSLLTKLICAAIEMGIQIARGLIYLLLKIHIKKCQELIDLIDSILDGVINKIKYELKRYKENPTGMIWFYFDRVDKILHIHDKFDPKLQPSEKWHPSYWYDEGVWTEVWPEPEESED